MHSGINIAVVEDYDSLRKAMVEYISANGYSAFGACSATELDQLFALHKFDIVVLDVNLPGESGFSIATRLRTAYPDIHIVMSTVRSSENERVQGYSGGADVFLPKPVSAQELLSVLSNFAVRISSRQQREAQIRLNLKRMELIGQQTTSLSKDELVILKALIEAPLQKIATYRLLELTGKEITSKAKSSLEVQLVHLRKKLKLAGVTGPAIKAIRNDGYQLAAELIVV